MRVLLVVHQFLPRHVAGTEIYTFSLAKGLRDRGHEVRIYTREEGSAGASSTERDDQYEGFPVRRFLIDQDRRRGYGIVRAFRRSLSDPAVDRAFDRLLREWRPDIVHFQHTVRLSTTMVGVAKRRRLPVVFTLHDYWYLCHRTQLLTSALGICEGPGSGAKCASCIQHPLVMNTRAEMGLRWIGRLAGIYRTHYMRRWLLQADLVIAPSEFLRGRFIAHGVPPEKIIRLPHGIALELFKGFQKRPADRLRIGFIGSIVVHKGVHLLSEAFGRLGSDKAELLIYGESTATPEYAQQLQQKAAGQPVRFMGGFRNDEIAGILSGLDLLVVPSIWPENAPLTIHEALAVRVPVIAARVGGIPALVRDGENGLLFEVGSVDSLAIALGRIAVEPHLIDVLRGNADEVEVKSIRAHAIEIEQLYLSLVRRSVGSPRTVNGTRQAGIPFRVDGMRC
ncbi:MAG: glycosyltransferase family 4 protein [Candidatus Methylomirabilis sp.]|nr:glycosyltransferase family 4 protein [Candidatus Methylomirabilis sp.]